ncbi:polymer-forming cytoskeletal protein [Thermoflavifilum thermophilum]|uniref:Uncharacterized protein n=1 Tax=Thermoflavifilum thermophilum TaxID=1393122 RepID=A0A1I7NBN3_9BACT|nr:polymer-forming cytoskeletal protein [Thermoflavifilum thermophilum]SFV32084.1 hypothetical protein SAMN05660895_1244 [Thermoflavifilum thermophilum]
MKLFTNHHRVACVVFFATFSILASRSFAQLKIGSNPTNIQKSAILELESDRQGLLLTRLTDTVLINSITPAPPDGMIIYLSKAPNPGLYVRRNGYWAQLSVAADDTTAFWRRGGNWGTDSAGNFLGTRDAQPVRIGANGVEAVHITKDGYLELPNLPQTTDTLQVLVIDPSNGNIIKRRNLSNAAFRDAIQILNGLRNEGITLKADSSTTSPNFGFTPNATDSTLTLNVPVVNNTTQTAGFLSYADYLKLQYAAASWSAAFSTTPDNNGLTVDNAAKVITLHAADATHPGAITAGTQTLGGDKTFTGNVQINQNLGVSGNSAVTGNSTVGGTLQVTGDATLQSNLTVNQNSTVNGNSTVGGTLNVTGAATFQNNATVNGNTVLNGNSGSTLTLANIGNAAPTDGNNVLIRNSSGVVLQKTLNQSAFKQLQVGKDASKHDIYIDSSAADKTIINIPTAADTVRGVMDTLAQKFAGTKSFRDSLAIGTTGTPNSTLQVQGSFSLAITTVTANYTATEKDHTILANCSGGPITVTLPNPAGLNGRIYTIKKIGNGGIDNALTITPSSGQIEGGSSYTIYNDWTFVTLQTDGTNWYIIQK